MNANDLERRRFLLALGTSTLCLGLSGCNALGSSWRYRFKLTVEVLCDGVVYRGAGVIGVDRNEGYREIGGQTHGEAVAVDIANRGTLFLLLRGDVGGVDWAFTMPHRAFAAQLGPFNMVDPKQIERLSQLYGASATLSPNLYPQMVRFGDVRVPTTVALVDPGDLAASFGPGVALKRVWIQIVGDRVTSGIEQRLPWLAEQKGALVKGSVTDARGGDAVIHQITDGDFEQGV